MSKKSKWDIKQLNRIDFGKCLSVVSAEAASSSRSRSKGSSSCSRNFLIPCNYQPGLRKENLHWNLRRNWKECRWWKKFHSCVSIYFYSLEWNAFFACFPISPGNRTIADSRFPVCFPVGGNMQINDCYSYFRANVIKHERNKKCIF